MQISMQPADLKHQRIQHHHTFRLMMLESRVNFPEDIKT